MKYVHRLKVTYPLRSDEHMADPFAKPNVKLRDVQVDERYPYYSTNIFYRLYLWLTQVLFLLVLRPIAILRLGLRVRGRHWLHQYRSELKGGAITICNHIFPWDYFCVRTAIAPRKQFLLMLKENIMTTDYGWRYAAGGIPLPTEPKGMRVFLNDMKRLLKDGHWLHIYPEEALHFYRQDVRPFKKGAFYFAVVHQKPIVPLAIALRPAKGIYRWFKGEFPLATVIVGEPLFANRSLSQVDAIEDLRVRAEKEVARLVDAYTPNAELQV